MSQQLSGEFEELRVSIGRLRAQLESLVVRGLRACGSDELAHLAASAQYLESIGAGHVGAILSQLRGQIEADDRGSPRTLLKAQIAVRLLDRLLSLRVVQGHFDMAVAIMDHPEMAQAVGADDEASGNGDADDSGEQDADE